MMSKEEILQKVVETIVSELGVEVASVRPESNIKGDLGADSLDTVELVMACESVFNISVPDADAEKLATVQDIVDYVASKQ
jgi:acyl carrier protein